MPISFKPGESDVRSIRRLLNGDDKTSHDDEPLDDPIRIVGQVRRCRVVVTGSYHPAVFALSQGIPVVALAQSEVPPEQVPGARVRSSARDSRSCR